MRKYIIAVLFICTVVCGAAQYIAPGNIKGPQYANQVAGYDNQGFLIGGVIANGTFHNLSLDTNTHQLVSILTIDSNGQIGVGLSSLGGYWTQNGSSLYPTTLSNMVGIGTATPQYLIDFRYHSGSSVIQMGDILGDTSAIFLGNTGNSAMALLQNNVTLIQGYNGLLLCGNPGGNGYSYNGPEAAGIFLQPGSIGNPGFISIASSDSLNNQTSSITVNHSPNNLELVDGTYGVFTQPDSQTYVDLYNDKFQVAFATMAGIIEFDGQVTINDGTQGLNKLLTSDANGNATWVAPTITAAELTALYPSLGKYANDAAAGVGGLTTGQPYVNSTTFALTFKQ